MNLTYLTKRLSEIDERLIYVESRISALPKGKLLCVQNGKYVKWYITTKRGKTYLPKSEVKTARLLAKKRLLEGEKEDLKNEKVAVESGIRYLNKPIQRIRLLQKRGYSELLLKKDIIDLLAYNNFVATINKREKSDIYLWPTVGGHYVRTKSEAFIVMYLISNQIPYHYEDKIEKKGIIIFSQFTIFNQRNNNVFYLEHFEKIDIPDNTKKMLDKIGDYIAIGIVPDINLMISIETNKSGFDMKYFESRLTYFL